VFRSLSRPLWLIPLVLAACGERPQPPVEPDIPEQPALELPRDLLLIPAHWDAMADWETRDPRPAIAAFERSCATWRRRDPSTPLNPRADWAGRIADWLPVCDVLEDEFATVDEARLALQSVFMPVRAMAIEPESETTSETGLLTGYYEPFVEVREQAEGPFTQPLRRRPDDLVTVDLGRFDPELAGRRLVGQVENGELVFYKDREEIERQNAGDVFAWGEPIHVFFLQI